MPNFYEQLTIDIIEERCLKEEGFAVSKLIKMLEKLPKNSIIHDVYENEVAIRYVKPKLLRVIDGINYYSITGDFEW